MRKFNPSSVQIAVVEEVLSELGEGFDIDSFRWIDISQISNLSCNAFGKADESEEDEDGIIIFLGDEHQTIHKTLSCLGAEDSEPLAKFRGVTIYRVPHSRYNYYMGKELRVL